MLRSSRSTFLASALLLTFSGFAFADIPGLTSFSGGNLATSGSDQLYGWVFTVNSPITVSALGVYDVNGVGLSVSHDVGIFEDSSTSLIGSTTVAAGPCGTLIDSFCYQSVSPFSLAAGDTYTIVMTMPQLNADSQWINNTVVNTASQISYVTSAFDNSSTLVYPIDDGPFSQGLFGPNFLFASTPEPAFYGVLGVGLAALIVARRRTRIA
jgi:hypothetical protein